MFVYAVLIQVLFIREKWHYHFKKFICLFLPPQNREIQENTCKSWHGNGNSFSKWDNNKVGNVNVQVSIRAGSHYRPIFILAGFKAAENIKLSDQK